MIELRKRRALKIVVGSVFIFSFILALMYPLYGCTYFARYRDKIHFLASPNPHAVFSPPSNKEADIMFVSVAVMKGSTYGSLTMAVVGYETYYSDHVYYEYHFYTDKLMAGEMFAYLGEKVTLAPDVAEYDVSFSRIDITMSEHQLNATVIVRDKTLFTAGFWADTGVPIESRVGGELAQEFTVEAYHPLLQASVSGLEVGEFLGGHFDYVDTLLFDSSLLP